MKQLVRKDFTIPRRSHFERDMNPWQREMLDLLLDQLNYADRIWSHETKHMYKKRNSNKHSFLRILTLPINSSYGLYTVCLFVVSHSTYPSVKTFLCNQKMLIFKIPLFYHINFFKIPLFLPYLPKPCIGGSTATGRISTLNWEDLLIFYKFHALINENFCFLVSSYQKTK